MNTATSLLPPAVVLTLAQATQAVKDVCYCSWGDSSDQDLLAVVVFDDGFDSVAVTPDEVESDPGVGGLVLRYLEVLGDWAETGKGKRDWEDRVFPVFSPEGITAEAALEAAIALNLAPAGCELLGLKAIEEYAEGEF